ncbi:FxsB family radical SAM/SPASM domain protein [Streptomyces sp. WMMC500]|uniref:FxsB family cyclophane-forming radical SAM/SPASM peptide maturase n=1 Tax=Streptomyces sp. WMMC500 TaxID=3015154 RepID=UPI00248BE5A9|nr:FxsB family cyclophane-forming radical SAM/SPASM peptide maturase [Streptomyces sp. WMMC500]WBB63167.1 FxsB family radical SAM/SPASM domain protein [Streptomyces sp. WMMC500]
MDYGDTGAEEVPWPGRLLDVGRLRATGVPAVPFRQFILKVHSRCNLSCTYCYVYHGADSSWRERPGRMPEAVTRRTAQRIAEHVRAHGLRRISLVLHGGEPLLAGAASLVRQTAMVRAALPVDCTVTAVVQTNGTLLTESALATLAADGIGVGLSADGGTPELNRHRVDHAGRPAWPALERAARLLRRHPGSYGGILCTVDVTASPAAVLDSLCSLGPPVVNFLLPHANWSAPPAPVPSRGPAPYGDWLCELFDLWWDLPRPSPRVRLFTEILGLLLGRPSGTEAVGLSPVTAVVVETDGAIEQIDSLKSVYEGAAGTGLDVFRNSFDEALNHPGVAARQLGLWALAEQCRRCPVVRVCGGGNYAHRFRAGEGFRNPSVYCADLERLIRHVAHRLDAAVADERRVPAGPPCVS